MGAKAEELRCRIITEADRLFYQQGYEATSFSDIASVVGITRGNFYYHFKSKDDILAAVIEKRTANFKAVLAQWDNEIADPRERLHYYMDIQSRDKEQIISHGCPVGGLCSELAKLKHYMHDNAHGIFEVLREWIMQQLKQMGFVKNRKSIAMHILARGQGVATIANTFGDSRFMQEETQRLKTWLDEELSKQ